MVQWSKELYMNPYNQVAGSDGGVTPESRGDGQPSNLSETKNFGGSQHSISSAGTVGSGSLPADDPETSTILQKQRKELFEEGIKR